jgi:ATP-binding cassette, subfamily F, member 3
LETAAPNHNRMSFRLHHLGLEDIPANQPIDTLSGGQKTRLALVLALLKDPQVLLLDEPTNHLDIPSRERFEQALLSFNGTVIAVVHNRYFIDRFTSRLWLVEAAIIEKAL